ncbi:MAG: class I adenylate-forming enzyme family protein [Spirochaetota bacterium]
MSNQPWVRFYGEMPSSLEYPSNTIFELFAESAKAHAQSTAVEFLDRKISYGQLLRQTESVAAGLYQLGVRRTMRIALVLPSSPHVPVALYAANRIGAIVSPFDPDESDVALSQFLHLVRPEWVFCLEEHVSKISHLCGRNLAGIIQCSLLDFGSKAHVRRLLRRRSDSLGNRHVLALSQVMPNSLERDTGETAPCFSWRALLSRGNLSEVPSVQSLHGPDETAVILVTSGTSSTPRGVLHGDAQLNAAALQTRMQGPLLTNQKVVGVIPFSHGFGLNSLIHAPILSGARAIYLPFWTPSLLAKTIQVRRPEYVIAHPSTYARLIDERSFRKANHRALMGAFSGGSRLTTGVRQEFERFVRASGGAVTIREGYGLTETVAACATMPEGVSRPRSVGVPYPDTEIRVGETRSPRAVRRGVPPKWVPADTPGEIFVSGPTVMGGYLDDESGTRSALCVDRDQRTWLATGDIGTMDADGFLYVIQRIEPLRDGRTSLHGYTEIVIAEHPDVRDVVLVRGSTTLASTAFVEPLSRDIDHGVLRARLLDLLHKLAPEQRPSEVVVLPRLPRTRSGSVEYAKLTPLTGST